VEWLKIKALSSRPSTTKKKKEKKTYHTKLTGYSESSTKREAYSHKDLH
jgi:hypothetical protein